MAFVPELQLSTKGSSDYEFKPFNLDQITPESEPGPAQGFFLAAVAYLGLQRQI